MAGKIQNENYIEAEIKIDPLELGKNAGLPNVDKVYTIILLEASITYAPGGGNLNEYSKKILKKILKHIKLNNQPLNALQTYYSQDTDPTSQKFCGWDRLNFSYAYDHHYKCATNQKLIDYPYKDNGLYDQLTKDNTTRTILEEIFKKLAKGKTGIKGWVLKVSEAKTAGKDIKLDFK